MGANFCTLTNKVENGTTLLSHVRAIQPNILVVLFRANKNAEIIVFFSILFGTDFSNKTKIPFLKIYRRHFFQGMVVYIQAEI